MIIKNLPQIGDPILRQKAEKVLVADINKPIIKRSIKNLIDTMRATDLVGMACPQLGKLFRIIVVEVRQTKYRKLEAEPLRVFINPKIINKSTKQVVDYEGCGSVLNGELFGPVKRHFIIEVEYLDENGKKQKEKFEDNMSIIIQHECDHLDGILFSDLITDNSKILDYNAYLKMRKEQRSKNKVK